MSQSILTYWVSLLWLFVFFHEQLVNIIPRILWTNTLIFLTSSEGHVLLGATSLCVLEFGAQG